MVFEKNLIFNRTLLKNRKIIMAKIFLSLMLSLSLVFLSGCENETIKNVKNSPINSNLTFAQALENAPYCINSKWSSSKDQNARDIVIHTCEISVLNKNIVAHKEKMLIEDEKKFRSERATYLKYDYERLNNLKEQLNHKTRYQNLINEKCLDGDAITSRSLMDACYDYKLQLNSIIRAEEEFIKKMGKNTISEAIASHEDALNNDKKLVEDDNKLIPVLVKNYNQKIIDEFPKSIHITRTVTITLLPNRKLEWSPPRFTTFDRSFTSSVFDLATRDIENERMKENANIDNFLLKNLYGTNTHKEFIQFVESQCTEDGCPLNFML